MRRDGGGAAQAELQRVELSLALARIERVVLTNPLQRELADALPRPGTARTRGGLCRARHEVRIRLGSATPE
eukprot:1165472-Rhodomonas_salina.1